MKPYRITIDTGTTNTRVVLWGNRGEKLQEEKKAVGVGDTARDGDNHRLKTAVKECLEELIQSRSVSYEEIDYIAASGMITSNLGLVEVPHITAPAGAAELAKNIYRKYLPDIAPIPITFIPGVKNKISSFEITTLLQMDIMRGEEVESIAVLKNLEEVPVLLILPGSHTKFVFTDNNKRILSCLTSMTGELISFLTQHSIAADAAGREFVTKETYDMSYVQMGYDAAVTEGVGRAAFSARIMNQFYVKDKSKISNYLLGIALESDIKVIQNAFTRKDNKFDKVIVAGRGIICRALYNLIDKNFENICVEMDLGEGDLPLSAQGVFEIMKFV